jgi:hypothetical protein
LVDETDPRSGGATGVSKYEWLPSSPRLRIGVWLVIARQHFDQRRLSRAVLPNQRVNLADGNTQIDLTQSLLAWEGFG